MVFEKFKKRIKKVFTKADTALGGRLPGGRTPAQVKASKLPQAGTLLRKPSEGRNIPARDVKSKQGISSSS